jgi:hypothetical protein
MFTTDEVATIRKFLVWMVENYVDSYNEGITAVGDDGITITEFSAMSDYDGCTLERVPSDLPWVALTDPDEYARQCDEENRERERWREAQRLQAVAQREAQERETLRILKLKYEQSERTGG